jgi:hypothetical protein
MSVKQLVGVLPSNLVYVVTRANWGISIVFEDITVMLSVIGNETITSVTPNARGTRFYVSLA